jgi:topoisomerase-4 subunit A
LARLEAIKIQQELDALRKEKSQLHDLLENPSSMKRLVIREIETDGKQFGDARRTLIEAAERAVVEQKVIDEPVTVVISQKGWVRARGGHGHDATQFTFKAGDSLYGAYECRTIDNVLAFGSNGRVYSVPVAALPGARGDGVPITTLLELASGSRILHYFVGPPDTTLLLASTAGYGFITRAGDMLSRGRGGKSFMMLDEGDEPLAPHEVGAKTSAIACLSEKARLLVFGLDEMKTLSGGGRGVILMELDKGEKLLGAQAISQRGVTVQGMGRGAKPQELSLSASTLAPHIGKRARKGKALESKIKPARLLANT